MFVMVIKRWIDQGGASVLAVILALTILQAGDVQQGPSFRASAQAFPIAIAMPTETAMPTATATTAATAAPTATATPALTPTSPPAPSPLLAIAVRGTRFIDASGRTIVLVGASRSSLEYDCLGDGHFSPRDFRAMRAWGMNIVRITLSSVFWRNAGNTCPQYHHIVMQAVANAESAGLFVMLTLQWNEPFAIDRHLTSGGAQCPMPDSGPDVRLWTDLATIYHKDQRVLFDLFSEPHDVSWETWLHGGLITNAPCYIITPGGGIARGTYRASGMKALVAAVRAIAPNNILILSGIDWGYRLNQLAHYAIAGINIVYSTHPYNYYSERISQWPGDIGAAVQQFPVIATEFGSLDCGTSYLSQAIAYFKAHQMSWLAWAWNIWGCRGPGLIADWAGKPSQPYGAYIRQQMLAVLRHALHGLSQRSARHQAD